MKPPLSVPSDEPQPVVESERWKSSNMIERALLFDWESRDTHDRPTDKITYSVERGTGDDRQVLVEDVDYALSQAIECAILTLDSLLAHARGEGAQ